MAEFVSRLSRPRKIIVFGTHGDEHKFEDVWHKLAAVLGEGDMVWRWGNEDEEKRSDIQFYNDSTVGNLSKMEAQPKGIHLLEMVKLERDRTFTFESRGEAPDVFMVGGPLEAYEQLEPFIAPCALIGHVGNDAACAHFAHMIQRTIENGITQAFAEGQDIFTKAAGFENQDIGRTMKKWTEEGSRLCGYLLTISHRVYYKRDGISKKGFVIDQIVDSILFNQVDTWVTLEATKLGIPAPTVNAMLEARFFSAMKDERVEASSILQVPELTDTPSVMKDQIATDLKDALYCTFMCVCAECFAIFQAASDVESWDANFQECTRLWNQPGSILESKLLEVINTSLGSTQEELKNLLLVPNVVREMAEMHMAWRRIVALSFASAIPCPTLSSALTYYDTYRARRMPTGAIRAQRDYFDASGYDRLDQDGWFTTCWTKEHTKEMRKKEAAMEREEGGDTPKKRRRKKSIDPESYDEVEVDENEAAV